VTGKDQGDGQPADAIVHAGCVALAGKGLLILGPSGSGKSSLALSLIALGCDLVSDDRTVVRRMGDRLMAWAPEAIRGRIEARGVGILSAPAVGPVRVALVCDLALPETDRLPPERKTSVAGVTLPLVHRPDSPHFPAAILLYLKTGRIA
jgi:HPr kinase/phosphorylase